MAYKNHNGRPRPLSDGAGEPAEARRSRAVRLCDVSESSERRKSCGSEKHISQKKISVGADNTCDACPDEGDHAVLDVRPDGEGEFVIVVIRCPADGEDGGSSPRSERVTVRLSVDQYAALSPKRGAISPAQADALCRAGQLAEAVRRATYLLQFGDLSERRLVFKLTAKGIDRAVAEDAASYLADKGLIAEDRGAIRRAEQNVRKLWGPRRIREDLRAQGYDHKAIEAAMLALEDREVDFAQSCATVIRRKWGGVPAGRAARARYRAALLRLGFESETVREAERLILNGED